jgi:hypothetical protein
MQTKPTRPRSRIIGSSARLLVGSSACQLVGQRKHPPQCMLGGGCGSLPPAPDERRTMLTKLMRPGSQIICLSACLLVGLDYYILQRMGETLAIFFHLFLFLIERLVQQQLVSLSTRRLIGLVSLWAHRLVGSRRGMFATTLMY